MEKTVCDVSIKVSRVSVDRPIEHGTLAGYMLPVRTTPLDYTLANDFMCVADANESVFPDDPPEGYSRRDIAVRNQIAASGHALLRQLVPQKRRLGSGKE